MKREWRAFSHLRESLRKNPFALLVGHFFYRLFAGEAFSSEDDLRMGIGGIAAILASPGVILPVLLLPKYSSFLRWMRGVQQFDYNTASISVKLMFVTFNMVVVGIVAVLIWERMFPVRLDYSFLASLRLG